MKVRDFAAAYEADARINGQTAVLDGLIRQYDQAVVSRSKEPQKVALWHFTSTSDRLVKALAAVWLVRHGYDGPI